MDFIYAQYGFRDRFSPVAKLVIVKGLLVVVAAKGYLNGDLNEEVFYGSATWLFSTGESSSTSLELVQHLQKSIYGLKQVFQDNGTISFPMPCFSLVSANPRLITPCSLKTRTLCLWHSLCKLMILSSLAHLRLSLNLS